MQKKIILSVTVILFFLNILAWQEVFVLNYPHYLKVKFFDVGQGDSEFVETPEGHQILIDGGPGSVVVEKLAKNMPAWDRTLDLVILSHPEKDHMQGLLEALKVYKADYILWSGVKKTAPEYDDWISVLETQKKMGAKIVIAKSGQEIVAGNVVIDTLFPFESLEGTEIKNTSNDSGIVSRVIYGNNSFLFTGDLSEKGEKQLVNTDSNLACDVLKVGHHGSKYSTSNLFLENVKPKIAVIEVGKNSYGHPTPETLQRLSDFGVKVLRTDQNGDITIISDGKNLKIN